MFCGEREKLKYRPVHIQYRTGGIREPLRGGKTGGAFLADAVDMGGHAQKILNLLTLYGKVKANGYGLHQRKARQVGNGVLFLQLQFRVNDGFQTQGGFETEGNSTTGKTVYRPGNRGTEPSCRH